MKRDIEVEVRGPITREQYQEMDKIFRTEGEFVESKDRIILDYSTFLETEGIRNRNLDIRLRVTNGIPEIVTKLGGWGGTESRKEISIKTEIGSFDRLVQNYALLGYTKAVLAERKAKVYLYQGVEFALVEVPNHSYYFEAEILSLDEPDHIAESKDILSRKISDLNLITFSKEEFYDYIETLNNEANEVFDYVNYKENYFKERFSLPS